MSAPFLLIDGYNLLHAAGLARLRYGPGDLERARHRMVGMLCEKLDVAEQMRCTVVYDAQNAPSDVHREGKQNEIRVLFAPPGQDADSAIEDLIARHPAAKNLIVVSSDHRLHKAAKRRGAQPVDSEVFWERLQIRPDARTALVAPKPPAPSRKPTSSSSTDAWLKEFGEFSVTDIAAEVQAEGQNRATADPWQQNLASLENVLNDASLLDQWLGDVGRGPPPRSNRTRG
ncbi:MAG TPA: NYN domain-containing protein [Planctomycetaceae bacterium]|nr:NYN domain-containing protein [Planctomycetaceae bacterium]